FCPLGDTNRLGNRIKFLMWWGFGNSIVKICTPLTISSFKKHIEYVLGDNFPSRIKHHIFWWVNSIMPVILQNKEYLEFDPIFPNRGLQQLFFRPSYTTFYILFSDSSKANYLLYMRSDIEC